MKYILVFILAILTNGCSKPIDKIYVEITAKSIFGQQGDFWKEANVLKKDGDMWTIEIDGRQKIIDIETASWKPMSDK